MDVLRACAARPGPVSDWVTEMKGVGRSIRGIFGRTDLQVQSVITLSIFGRVDLLVQL